jgi:hypothetical protein
MPRWRGLVASPSPATEETGAIGREIKSSQAGSFLGW